MPKRKSTTPRPRYGGRRVPASIQQMVAKKLMAGITDPMKTKDKMDLLPWVMKHRRFDGQPPSMPNFLMDVYNDRHPEIIFMKAAQVGISEWGVNETLWVADQRWGNRGVGLYVFPKQEQMDDFSQARVAKAIDDSYYLKERVKALDKVANRVRLRKLNGTPIYYRGSDSVMQIRSIDADIVVCVPESTEILTKQGWKHHWELEDNELVLAYEQRRNTMQWVPLQGKVTIDAAQTVKLSSDRFSGFTYTPNHRWIVEDWKGNEERRPIGESWGTEDRIKISAPLSNRTYRRKIEQYEASFLGWFFGDGNAHSLWKPSPRLKDGYAVTSQPVIVQSNRVKKHRQRENLRHIMKSIPHRQVNAKDKTARYYIPVAWIRKLYKKFDLQPLGKKTLTQVILDMEPRLLRRFVKGSIDAEGDDKGRFTQSAPHADYINAFELATFLLGNGVHRWQGKTRDIVYVNARPPRRFLSQMKLEDAGVQSVWCPKTELGTWVVRQGDQISITGNCDEVDLFREGSVDKAKERLGSAERPLFRAFSQPQYPKGPIDELYDSSDQRYYYIPCEHCNTKQRLTWDENIDFNLKMTDVRVICKNCKKVINRLAEGEWIAHEPDKYAHGYQISKLYSPRANLPAMVRKYANQSDPETVQSFWNADMGIPHRPEGTPGLESFLREVYPWMTQYQQQAMGIDVGRMLHIAIIGRDNPSEPWRLTFIEAVNHFELEDAKRGEVSLEERWQQYLPNNTIIDAGGDPRATAKWAEQHRGKVRLWQHRPSAVSPEWTDDGFVNMHRTALLDLLYSTLKSHTVILHQHAGQQDKDFWPHLEANVKELVMEKDREVLRYSPKSADHYAFALAFAILAAGLRPSGGQIQIVPKTVPKDAGSDEDMVAVRSVGQSATSYGMGRWTGNLGPGKWGRWR